jgi:hypothetical protein
VVALGEKKRRKKEKKHITYTLYRCRNAEKVLSPILVLEQF